MYIIDDIFTDEEYNVINKTDLDYNTSLFDDVINEDVRKCKQCNIMDDDVINILRDKIKHISNCINPMLRYIKYEKNDYMKLHIDDNYLLDGKYSKYTMIVYLNTCDSYTTIIDSNYNEINIKAIKGRILVFDQDLEHKTSTSEIKYIIRTDVY